MSGQTKQVQPRRQDDQFRILRGEGAAFKHQLDGRAHQHQAGQGGWDRQRQDDQDNAAQQALELSGLAAGRVFRQGWQQRRANGGADNGFRQLQDKPAIGQRRHRPGAQPRGQVVGGDEHQVDQAQGEHARPHQAQHAPHRGIRQRQLRCPMELITHERRHLDGQVQQCAQYHAVG